MLRSYVKEKNGTYHIYEKGLTYLGMTLIKVNRMFKGIDFKPLTFSNNKIANDFCNTRNSIMSL